MNQVFQIKSTRRLADDETTVKTHQRHKEMYDLHKKLYAALNKLMNVAKERVAFRRSEVEAIFKIEMDDSIACVDPKIAAIKKAKEDAMDGRKSLKQKVRKAKADFKSARKDVSALRKDFWRMKGRFDDRSKDAKAPAAKGLRRLQAKGSCASLTPLWKTHHTTAVALMDLLDSGLKLRSDMLITREKCLDAKHEMRDKDTPKEERKTVIKKCKADLSSQKVARKMNAELRVAAREAHVAAEKAIYDAEAKLDGIYGKQ